MNKSNLPTTTLTPPTSHLSLPISNFVGMGCICPTPPLPPSWQLVVSSLFVIYMLPSPAIACIGVLCIFVKWRLRHGHFCGNNMCDDVVDQAAAVANMAWYVKRHVYGRVTVADIR